MKVLHCLQRKNEDCAPNVSRQRNPCSPLDDRQHDVLQLQYWGNNPKGAREERLAMLPTVTVCPMSFSELIGPV